MFQNEQVQVSDTALHPTHSINFLLFINKMLQIHAHVALGGSCSSSSLFRVKVVRVVVPPFS